MKSDFICNFGAGAVSIYLSKGGFAYMFKRILCFSAAVFMLWAGTNIAEEKETFTADSHKSRGVTCVVCHGEEQPKAAAPAKACLACHESLKVVAEKASNIEPNPHSNHLTQSSDVECTQCHQGHKADTPLCHQCHQGMQFAKSEAESK